MPVYTHLISFGFGPKYELDLRVISLKSVLHCSIFWFIWGVQLSELSIVYLVESTVFSLEPPMYSRVKIFLFFGENTIATFFSGLNVRLASRLLSTSWLSTACILCCITVKFVPLVKIHRLSANPCPSVRSVFIIFSA